MRLRDVIFSNFWLKIFSLALAVLIWFTIRSNLPSEIKSPGEAEGIGGTRHFIRPITVRTGLPGPVELRAKPDEVNITVSGDPTALNGLTEKDIQAFVEIEDIHDLRGLYPIQVTTPKGITPVRVLPYAVRVEAVNPP